MLPFAVVEFSNHGLAVIATKWFTGPEEDECYWPPAKMNSTRAAIKQKDPCTDWVTHEVTVKRKAGNVPMCILYYIILQDEFIVDFV